MSDTLRLFVGDCTATFENGDRTEHRGQVAVVVKPDDTVLVHDADGYQPVAWLTRADAVAVTTDDGLDLTAHDGDRTLRVRSHTLHLAGSYPVSDAGEPVGHCPDCDGALVRTTRAVTCLGCDRRYGIPTDATCHGGRCDCGLPRIRVERGTPIDCCVDYTCESLYEAVIDRFDRAWDCPDCGDDLRVFRKGGLLVGCDDYPDCDATYSFPAGSVVGDCDCGLPVFETGGGRRCLDSACDGVVEPASVDAVP
ncbi:topoisomerase DNA-binding C4 zinc finger domain-containing protein [Haloarchaeobius salinus]|uniref:topoisomerase DNA-binding C4 zinc finger domain-containing protein n=1 Tax=Haloarchaeobius salinus TaxID=1198298 RepID=UPI00210E093E|nr:topoisomerase DNA-binding C4 zinc finger domain-containing protein [Haloarchaeobius salinus]